MNSATGATPSGSDSGAPRSAWLALHELGDRPREAPHVRERLRLVEVILSHELRERVASVMPSDSRFAAASTRLVSEQRRARPGVRAWQAAEQPMSGAMRRMVRRARARAGRKHAPLRRRTRVRDLAPVIASTLGISRQESGAMKDSIQDYIKRVQDLAEHVRGNEQATKQSLIGPLFTLLGYDLTDPRQCVPEYKVDFGKERSVKPIDWAFFQGGKPTFFVEAKEVGRKLAHYDEQLADYFAKAPEVKLGILTNGIQWRFYTDLTNQNVMDKEPFVKWDVLGDEPPPIEFLAVLQRSEYNTSLLRTYAQRTYQHNLLLGELNRLLEPAPEFTKLAVANIETRNLTAAVVESWKPVLASAINEWAKQRALNSVVASAQRRPEPAPEVPAAEAKEPRASKAKIETTPEELAAFATIQGLLGKERPIAYEDTASYFKIHLPERRFSTVCRFSFRKKGVLVLVVPVAPDRVTALAQVPSAPIGKEGWASVTLDSAADLPRIAEVLRAAWDVQKSGKAQADDGAE